MLSDVARVHDPPGFCVHDFETVTPVVIAEIEEMKLARLVVQFALPRDTMVRRLQDGRTGIGGLLPKNTSYGESMPLFALVAERLNPSEAHTIDSIHKFESSGFQIP